MLNCHYIILSDAGPSIFGSAGQLHKLLAFLICSTVRYNIHVGAGLHTGTLLSSALPEEKAFISKQGQCRQYKQLYSSVAIHRSLSLSILSSKRAKT